MVFKDDNDDTSDTAGDAYNPNSSPIDIELWLDNHLKEMNPDGHIYRGGQLVQSQQQFEELSKKVDESVEGGIHIN